MEKIITITGPSGSGKTTLVRELIEINPCFCEVVSFTTRKKRAGEVEGVDYYFVDDALVANSMSMGDVVEHVEFNGSTYGIFKSELDLKVGSGKVPLLVLDPTGVAKVSSLYSTISVYLEQPLLTIYERFLGRLYSEDHPDLKYYSKRLMSIEVEHRTWPTSTYFDYVIQNFTSGNNESIVSDLIDLMKVKND